MRFLKEKTFAIFSLMAVSTFVLSDEHLFKDLTLGMHATQVAKYAKLLGGAGSLGPCVDISNASSEYPKETTGCAFIGKERPGDDDPTYGVWFCNTNQKLIQISKTEQYKSIGLFVQLIEKFRSRYGLTKFSLVDTHIAKSRDGDTTFYDLKLEFLVPPAEKKEKKPEAVVRLDLTNSSRHPQIYNTSVTLYGFLDICRD